MLKVTNNTINFFEKEDGSIIIYGAGNHGYWLGYYLNQCKIDFLGYIDENPKYTGALCNGKPIWSSDYLKQFNNKNIRIIIATKIYESVVCSLLFADNKYQFHALCLVPRYMNYLLHTEIYDINYLLGYFRHQLYIGNTPTIISNDCTAGHIYHAMDMIMLSPTINTAISSEDFLKLCKAPKEYFDIEVKELFFNVLPLSNEPEDCRKGLPTIKINDITVSFGHTDLTTELLDRWNMMRKQINWDNLIFIFRANKEAVPENFQKEFSKIKYKKLLLIQGDYGKVCTSVDQMFMSEYAFAADWVIENYFDLLGWLNEA